MAKILQFELWEECNNHCTFCYLGNNNLHTPNEVKLNSLKNAYNEISNLNNYPEFDTISYLGGEFFQGQLNTPQIRDDFMRLMTKTADLLREGYVKEVWIYMTLTIGYQQDLYDTIKLFEGVTDKLWLLTSYDTEGRFHSPKMEENWKFHMKNIHNLYPDIRFNTTVILSSDCIRKYLNDEISFQQMEQEYHTLFFFKQVGCESVSARDYNKVFNTDFVPTRKLFLEFLRKFRMQENELMWDKMFNIHYRADVLYRNGNDIEESMVKNIRHKDRGAELEIEDETNSHINETLVAPCGHLMSYHAYSDCDGCVLCDKEAMSLE